MLTHQNASQDHLISLKDLPAEMLISIFAFLDVNSLYDFVKAYDNLILNNERFQIFWINIFNQFFPYFTERFLNVADTNWSNEFEKAYDERVFFEKVLPVIKNELLTKRALSYEDLYQGAAPRFGMYFQCLTKRHGFTFNQSMLDHLYAIAGNHFKSDDKNDYATMGKCTGWRLLDWAAYCNQPTAIHLLSSVKGVDINASYTKNKVPPLSTASGSGRYAAVEALIANGASVDALGFWQRTALHFSSIHGHAEVVKLLLLNRADVNSADCNNNRPLHCAAAIGHSEVLDTLLKTPNIYVNAKNDQDVTPLYKAVQNHQIVCIEKLLSTPGIDITTADGLLSGFPLVEAKKIANPEIRLIFVKMINQQRLLKFIENESERFNAHINYKGSHTLYMWLESSPTLSDLNALIITAKTLKSVIFDKADPSIVNTYMDYLRVGELGDIYKEFYDLGEFNLPDINSNNYSNNNTNIKRN